MRGGVADSAGISLSYFQDAQKTDMVVSRQESLGATTLNNFEDGHPNRNAGDRAKARPTGHGTRVALDVADMPYDLGKLLDKGIEE